MADLTPTEAAGMPLPTEAAKALPLKDLKASTEKQKEVEALKEKIDKATGAEAKTLSGLLDAERKPTTDQVDLFVQNNLGYIDSTGTRVFDTTREADLRASVKRAIEVLDNTADLTKPEFATVVADLNQVFQQMGLLDLEIDTIGGGKRKLNATEIQNAFKALLKDPASVELVRTKLNDLLKTNNSSQDVTDADVALKAAEKDLAAKKGEKVQVGKDIPTKKTRLADFNNPASTVAQRLVTLEGGDLESLLAGYESNLRILESRFAQKGYVPNPAEQKDHADAVTRISNTRKLITERNGLQSEKANLPGEISSLQDRQKELDVEIKDAEGKEKTARTKFDIVDRGRKYQESLLMERVGHVIRDGIVDQIQRRQEVLKDQQEQALRDQEAKKGDKAEAALAKGQRKRYYTERNPGKLDPRKSRITLKKAEARADVSALLKTDQGLKTLVDQALRAGGMTDAEITTLTNDPAYVERAGKQIAQEAFNVYFQTGGRLTKQEYAFLSNQPWAAGMIEAGLEKNQAMKDLDAKLKEQGIKGGVKEILGRKKIIGGGILALILMAAGGIVAAPAAASIIAGAAA